jgi:hypothetical protein
LVWLPFGAAFLVGARLLMMRVHIAGVISEKSSAARRVLAVLTAFVILIAQVGSSIAEDSDAELAKKLANPVASLINIPVVYDYNQSIGANNGHRSSVTLKPVVPLPLNNDWVAVSRTIVPLVSQHDVSAVGNHEFGLGDTSLSFFITPKDAPSSGPIWGAGPVFLLPTATDNRLGSEKWGVGPTAVVLTQEGPWTVGVLGSHLWSFAGSSSRADVNASFMQPFAAYRTADAWTFSLNTESTYNWNTSDWSVPINASVSKIVRLGKLPVSVGGGVRYWAESSPTDPEGWSATFSLKFILPASILGR